MKKMQKGKKGKSRTTKKDPKPKTGLPQISKNRNEEIVEEENENESEDDVEAKIRETIAERDDTISEDGFYESEEEQQEKPEPKLEQNEDEEGDFISLSNREETSEKDNQENDEDPKDRGVIYLGRIPHGFYEDEMRGFFSQFGTVTRLRLSRNKTTAKSKHYAFIEFDSSEVAEIVAKTMNNYLLYGHRLICKVIPEEQIHPELFKGANKKFKKIPWQRINRDKFNQEKSMEQIKKNVKKLVQREKKQKRKLKELGIDYDFPGYMAQVPKKPKHIKFNEKDQ